jgi:hypothetical protein
MRKTILVILTLASVFLMASCSKGKTAQTGTTSGSSGGTWELTEESLGRYYKAVAKLNAAYPKVPFENAARAATRAAAEGIDIKKAVAKEAGISYEEYVGVSSAIMKALAASLEDSSTESMIEQVQQMITITESTDTKDYDAEQKETLKRSLEDQKAQLAELKARASSPEFLERKRIFDMIEAAKRAAGL